MLPGIGIRSPPPSVQVIASFHERWPYNGLVAESLKVPKDKFEGVIKALLNAPPMPLVEITGKRQRRPDAKKPGPKKRPSRGAFMCRYERSYF